MSMRFEAALAGRVPDSTLLSHDLFEGTFARAGLASDIEVVEEFPARYDVDALRHHRWARGDWQLLPWIFGRGPVAGADDARRMPAIGRWKMLDNLRRTLSAPACVLALLAGWALPFAAAAVWTGFVLLTILLPPFLPVVSAIVPRRAGITLRSHLAHSAPDLRTRPGPDGARRRVPRASGVADGRRDRADAVAPVRHPPASARMGHGGPGDDRTPARPPRLLSRDGRRGRPRLFWRCWSPWLAGHGAWPVAVPFAALWIASPAIARWTSRPPPDAGRMSGIGGRRPGPAADRAPHLAVLRNLRHGCRPHAAAGQFPGRPGSGRWPTAPLPPISAFTCCPRRAPATSRWVGTAEAVERLEATLAAMGGLDRFRGHFYNWYDTRDLRPLDPRYVSAVDSGNLAGHLIAARQCLPGMDRPRRSRHPVVIAGIEDALSLAREARRELPDDRRTGFITRRELDFALDALGAALRRRL